MSEEEAMKVRATAGIRIRVWTMARVKIRGRGRCRGRGWIRWGGEGHDRGSTSESCVGFPDE